MGILFLVATPIGNLEDISARALRTLAEVQLIAVEDTRHTRKLLNHFKISTRTTSYYEYNKISKLDSILGMLETGDVALVSDAGTPALNDPGYELVKAALQAGHNVSPIPGASAPVAALVVSGLPTDSFVYLGYLPRKSTERRRFIKEVENLPYTLIFLETPHRLLASLSDLQEILGDRQMAAARELTKLHEEILRSPISEIREHFSSQPPRGEFTLVVAGKTINQSAIWTDEQLQLAIREGLLLGEAASALAARLADESGWQRRKIYQRIIESKD
jgi:16S rRNA (cytidine1402-2'-O)-methyltransferase